LAVIIIKEGNPLLFPSIGNYFYEEKHQSDLPDNNDSINCATGISSSAITTLICKKALYVVAIIGYLS
jgi:hypothetical protein